MKRSTLLISLALGSALAVGGVLLAPSIASEIRPDAASERQWLSIRQVHDKLEAAGYRHIKKIERERGDYEVRATDRDGQRVKLYVNPQTGEISNQRRDGKRAGAEGGRASTDCTERRCRDDLPPKPASSTPAAK